jgi:hypothetical protein
VLHSYHRLRIAVAASHGQVEPERVAVDDVHVASFRPAERVDATAERAVCADIDHDPCVLAVHGHVVAGASVVAVHVVLLDLVRPHAGETGVVVTVAKPKGRRLVNFIAAAAKFVVAATASSISSAKFQLCSDGGASWTDVGAAILACCKNAQ